MRTCPPRAIARKVMTRMTNSVVHLADVVHMAYNGTRIAHGRRKNDKIIETVRGGKNVYEQINPKKSKRKTGADAHIPHRYLEHLEPVEADLSLAEGTPADDLTAQAAQDPLPAVASRRPGQDGLPTSDVFVNLPDFKFNANVTSLSHETLCSDLQSHETQGQFCSDFRSLDSLYPVFSPSTMPGFSDVVIPSRRSSST